ncbi:MAG: HAMP domain-containing protein [Xanthomonadales bacterium]|nr:HAMP domain-containing protein [Xanthomonadales bacterium]
MTSLFWKLFLTMWLSIVGFSAAIGVLNDKLAREQWAEEPANTFSRGLYRIGQRLRVSLAEVGIDAAREELLAVPRYSRSYIYVVDAGAREILQRDEELGVLKDRHRRMEAEVVSDAAGQEFTIYMVDRIPPSTILAPGAEGTALRILFGAIISAMVSFFLARSLTAPLEGLRLATRKIAAGDLNTRVGQATGRRHDEFSQLAADFDVMAERLQTMQQANRRLLRDVSHELRSPLARLSVAVEIARKKGAENIRSELDRIELEGQRLESLVNDVLGLLRESSEHSPKQDEDLDLAELLTELVEVVNYEVPEGKPGITWQAPAPTLYRGDRELLWRTMENLLRNALRHTDADRGVVLSLSHDEQQRQIEMIVRDYGGGVPEPELDLIFQPFYRVQESRDRSTGGHGIGLAIAATAVGRHGGKIKASNAPGGGLSMRVALPMPNRPA